MDAKPKIGFLGLTLELYDRSFPDLIVRLRDFAETLCGRLEAENDVVREPVVFTRPEVDRAVARFEAEGVDAIIIVLLSYSPSLIALPALLRTRLPLIILNTQRIEAIGDDFSPQDMIDNHGMHGVQDLCNVLGRHGRSFELITGHFACAETQTRLTSGIRGAAAVSAMHGRRIGIIGHTFDGMGDLYVDGTLLLARTGVEACHISSARLAECIVEVSDLEIDATVAADREAFVIDPAVTDEDLHMSARVEIGLRALVAEESLSGVCPLFYAATDHPGVRMLPFVAVSKFLAEGMGYGGEGDATSATAVLLMQQLTRETNFTEMFTIDFGGNSILMNHMAETNYTLSRPDVPPMLHRNEAAFLSGAPPLCVFAVQRPGAVTLANLAASAGGRLKMIVFRGEIDDWGPVPGVLSPHFRLRPDCPNGIGAFLDRYSLEGGSHHLAISYGDHRASLRTAARLMGVDFVDISGG